MLLYTNPEYGITYSLHNTKSDLFEGIEFRDRLKLEHKTVSSEITV